MFLFLRKNPAVTRVVANAALRGEAARRLAIAATNAQTHEWTPEMHVHLMANAGTYKLAMWWARQILTVLILSQKYGNVTRHHSSPPRLSLHP